ncbi:hypothetical protein [Thalassovita sp.]|uniref:hypothetical protein n=1 Tax=Thalassovita sp. TaxID=1979401 RepID=UPI002B265862|nr:hypothetical protein [Thalassovita sp.]
MNAQILHSGFDGLRFTLQAQITPELRKEFAQAKVHAKEHNQNIDLHFGARPRIVVKNAAEMIAIRS